jgi:hypothetical protein
MTVLIFLYNKSMAKLTGDVIEESLKDKSVLKNLDIKITRVEKVTKKHRTPWLKQWTLCTISVPEDKAASLAETLSQALEANHWYVDYKNDTTHYVIFPGKVFKVNRKQPKEYKPVVDYGLSLHIPIYQLDFSPEIKYWERPEQR